MALDDTNHPLPLTLLDPDGGWINAPVHVSQLRGRPVMLFFWSMDCSSCVEQLDQVQEWLREYGPRGLRVIGVDVTNSEAELRDTNAVEAFAQEHGVRYPIAVDDGSMAQAYGIVSHPSCLVFDAQGLLSFRASSPEQLRELWLVFERLTGPETSTGAVSP